VANIPLSFREFHNLIGIDPAVAKTSQTVRLFNLIEDAPKRQPAERGQTGIFQPLLEIIAGEPVRRGFLSGRDRPGRNNQEGE
jgi:hypothetical protein